MGLGTSAVGTSPLGFGEPLTSERVPTQTSEFSRYINPATGQYEIDGDTLQIKSMPGVRQRMLLRLKTLRGSSTSLPMFGVQLPSKINAQFAQRMRSAVRAALYYETDVDRVAEIISIEIETGGERAAVRIRYNDLTTGEQDAIEL